MAILNDENYVDKAEGVIKALKCKGLTMTQLRNLLSLTSSLYDDSKEKSFEELSEKFSYLRIRFVYQAGRDKGVKALVEQAKILEILKEIKDKEALQRFCRYMEALVAYFKFYEGGGK